VSANPSSRIIRFSTFEVNLDTGELRQRGQKVTLLGMLHACRNQRDPALECVRKALESPRSFGHTHHSYYQIACIYAVLGEIDKAIAWLERSVETGNPCWRFFRIDPCLKNLRDEPRFQSLVADLEREFTALKIERL